MTAMVELKGSKYDFKSSCIRLLRVNNYVLGLSEHYVDGTLIMCKINKNIGEEKRIRRAVANLPIKAIERKLFAGRMFYGLTVDECKRVILLLRALK